MKNLANILLIIMGCCFSLTTYSIERICAYCIPLNDGDFFHRSDVLTPGWIGHAGIKMTIKDTGVSTIYDFNIGRTKGKALQGITMDQWLVNQAFWGAKRSSHADLRRVNMMAAQLQRLMSGKTEYDGNHSNQKGKYFQYSNDTSYFEADCVGFVEGLHEHTFDDLTPNKLEEVILRVQTQRDESLSFEVGR